MENLESKKWDTKQLQEDFYVLSFLAPFVTVIHKETGDKGTLEFSTSPRLYFNFMPED